jgi:hypothetical protein
VPNPGTPFTLISTTSPPTAGEGATGQSSNGVAAATDLLSRHGGVAAPPTAAICGSAASDEGGQGVSVMWRATQWLSEAGGTDLSPDRVGRADAVFNPEDGPTVDGGADFFSVGMQCLL